MQYLQVLILVIATLRIYLHLGVHKRASNKNIYKQSSKFLDNKAGFKNVLSFCLRSSIVSITGFKCPGNLVGSVLDY